MRPFVSKSTTRILNQALLANKEWVYDSLQLPFLEPTPMHFFAKRRLHSLLWGPTPKNQTSSPQKKQNHPPRHISPTKMVKPKHEGIRQRVRTCRNWDSTRGFHPPGPATES
jgi:hypothetical protein